MANWEYGHSEGLRHQNALSMNSMCIMFHWTCRPSLAEQGALGEDEGEVVVAMRGRARRLIKMTLSFFRAVFFGLLLSNNTKNIADKIWGYVV